MGFVEPAGPRENRVPSSYNKSLNTYVPPTNSIETVIPRLDITPRGGETSTPLANSRLIRVHEASAPVFHPRIIRRSIHVQLGRTVNENGDPLVDTAAHGMETPSLGTPMIGSGLWNQRPPERIRFSPRIINPSRHPQLQRIGVKSGDLSGQYLPEQCETPTPQRHGIGCWDGLLVGASGTQRVHSSISGSESVAHSTNPTSRGRNRSSPWTILPLTV